MHWEEENCDKGDVANTDVGLSGQRGLGSWGFSLCFLHLGREVSI